MESHFPCAQVKAIEVDDDGYALVMTETGVTKLEPGSTIVVPLEVFVRLLKGEN